MALQISCFDRGFNKFFLVNSWFCEIGGYGRFSLGGSGSMLLQKVLKSRSSEMAFPAMWTTTSVTNIY